MAPGRILIVEDEALIALDIETSLREAGYEVVGVADRYRKAVQIAEQEHPDLVLMDVELAGPRSGIEAARLIRQRYGIPSLLVAAQPARALAVHAAAVNAAGWLPKPASRDRLTRAVADALK